MKLLKTLLFFSFLAILYLPTVNALPNPAAIYCQDLGYEYKIIKSPSGEYGICILPDKTCRGWKFFSGECGKEYSYCAKQGYDLITKTDGKNPYSPKYAVCVYTKGKNKGKEVGAVSDLLNFDTRFEGYEFRIEEESAVLEQTFTPITEATDGLPSYFDWRDATLDADGHGVPGNGIGFDWMTPVEDQGTCGDCWNFPATGAVEADARIEYNDLSLYLDLSEQDVLSCGGIAGCQGGGSSSGALRYIRDTGVVDEPCFPRTGIDVNGCQWTCCDGACVPPVTPTLCSDKCLDWENRVFNIYSYGAVPDAPADMKNFLINEGPFVIYMYYGAGDWTNGILTCDYSGPGINHAAVLVSYDDIGGYWVLKNSWGANWGPNGDGYLKLAYGSCNLDARVYVNTKFPSDVDGDGILNENDNCWYVYNPGQEKSSGYCPGQPYTSDPRCGDACCSALNEPCETYYNCCYPGHECRDGRCLYPLGNGGCPTLFVYDGKNYVKERKSGIHSQEGIDVVDEIVLKTKPVAEAGVYSLSLKETTLPEHSHIDSVKLLVDGKEAKLISAWHSKYGDVTYILKESDDVRTDTQVFDSIDLKFLAPELKGKAEFSFTIEGYNPAGEITGLFPRFVKLDITQVIPIAIIAALVIIVVIFAVMKFFAKK